MDNSNEEEEDFTPPRVSFTFLRALGPRRNTAPRRSLRIMKRNRSGEAKTREEELKEQLEQKDKTIRGLKKQMEQDELTIEHLRKQLTERSLTAKDCLMCTEVPSDVVFGPCGHMICCEPCATRILRGEGVERLFEAAKCPMCKEEIIMATKPYI